MPFTAARLEGAELGGREHLAQVAELQPEAHVGLVGAVDLHRVVPGHPLDRAGTLAGDLLGGVEHGLADHGHHVVGGGEAHLGVELHELELPVGPQVFVAEATGDLVVAVEATDHEQLLEQLRALRQGVERSRRQAGRHHEVARAFGSGGDEHRRLDLDESLRVEGAAQRRVHAGAGAEVALHTGATKVEVAVPQAQHFVGVDAVVDRERHRLGLVQDLERGRADFDLAGGQRVVDGAFRPWPHRSLDADHVLTAHPVRCLAAGLLGIDHDLHDARGVADVEEDDTAVVAAAVDPSAHHDVATDVGDAEVARPIRAHHANASSSRLDSNHATSVSRDTSTCSPERRSFTATAFRSASARPSITPYTARDRSAAFHCAFTERSPYARSTRNPFSRSTATRPATSVSPPAPRPLTTNASTSRWLGSRTRLRHRTRSATRSIPIPKPIPGVGAPPSCSASWS